MIRRTASLLVVAARLGIDELSSQIGLSADSSSGKAWRISETGTGSDDLTVLIETLLRRVDHVWSALLSVATRPGSSVVLRVVQYVSDDPVGPGFAIDAELVLRLAQLRATIDVDQYFDSDG